MIRHTTPELSKRGYVFERVEHAERHIEIADQPTPNPVVTAWFVRANPTSLFVPIEATVEVEDAYACSTC